MNRDIRTVERFCVEHPTQAFLRGLGAVCLVFELAMILKQFFIWAL